MSFEAYSVAIRLRLLDSVSTGLVAMSRQFSAFNTHVNASQAGLKELEGRLKNIKMLGLFGGAAAGLGLAGLWAFKAPIDEARQWQQEIARFSALGLGDNTTREAVKFAQGMDIMGSSMRDNLKLLRETTTIVGDLSHAEALAPTLAKMKFGIDSVMGDGQGTSFADSFQAAIKTTELRGALVNRTTGKVDPERAKDALNYMMQAYVASGGLVTPQMYLAAIKTGGVSTKLMSDEMFYFGLGHFMQESGGSRIGTASMSIFQNWSMGRVSQQVAEHLVKDGFVDRSHLHYGKTGHQTKLDVKSMRDADLLIENPFRYVNEVMVPQLKKLGYKGDALNFELASLLGIRTASNLADQFVRDEKIADLYIERSKRAANIDQLYGIGGDTLTGKQIDLRAKWSDTKLALGDAALPYMIKAVGWLTDILKAVKEFAHNNPTIFKGLVTAFLDLSALTLAGGAITLIIAGLKGLSLALSVTKGMALGAQLQQTAFGITSLRGALSRLGLYGLAGGLGYQIGSGLYDNAIQGTKFDDNSGRQMAKIMAFFGSQDAKDALREQDRWSAIASNNRTTVIHTHFHMDGRKHAESVTRHQEKRATRPSTSTSNHDPRQMPVYSGSASW